MRTILPLLLGILFFGSLTGHAQAELSAYKYTIVPTKFEGFKNQNQYQTSTLIKFLLVEKGFNAVYENALPNELNNNKCLGVTANLVNESGTFTTKSYIEFVDCKGGLVYRTETGSSKIKDYKEAYKEVIRKAFRSMDGYTYSYNPKDPQTPVTLSFEDDVKTLPPSTTTVVQKEQTISKPAVVTEAETVAKAGEPSEPVTQEAEEGVQDNIWYAQEISNGYQLVDRTPTVQLRIYRTERAGIFLAESETQRGIVYEQSGVWYFDYYQDGELVHQPLNIKF